jgi:hypothetical protein
MSIGEDIRSRTDYPSTPMRRTALTTWLRWTCLSPHGAKPNSPVISLFHLSQPNVQMVAITPLIATKSCRCDKKAWHKGQKLVVKASRPLEVSRDAGIGQGQTKQPETPASCGEPWEVTTNVRCRHEVRKIETLTKAEPVQHQRDRSVLPRSRTSIHSTLT